MEVKGVGVAALAVTLAVAIVSTLTIDLGPGLRALAEREGSKRVGRAMRIGRLGVRLFTGKFVLEDFSIAGLSRSFFASMSAWAASPVSQIGDQQGWQ